MNPNISAIGILGAAALLGAGAGVASVVLGKEERKQLSVRANSMMKSLGMVRKREPQAGDYWRNCSEAKAAGTYPIYRNEPGYRKWLDGDNDGAACEPYRGD